MPNITPLIKPYDMIRGRFNILLYLMILPLIYFIIVIYITKLNTVLNFAYLKYLVVIEKK